MINVIGLGYIGLPTALMLASHGQQVVGTDCNRQTVDQLKQGSATFDEPGLKELYQTACRSGIQFCEQCIKTDVYIIAVATPYDSFSKKIDASYVCRAVEDVLQVCQPESMIIIESTVSPSTMDRFVRPLLQQRAGGMNVHLVHAPERIIPGNMIYELEHNCRTIGADCSEIGQKAKRLYASFCKGQIIVTDIRTAEMTKVVENTFRAVNIAFANELAKICRYADLDVHEVIRICNMHPRVNILSPGPGVGGHCIAVDPWFLVGDYPSLTPVIRAAMEVNASMPEFVLRRTEEVMRQCGVEDLSRVGLYGLTYKENIDDYRQSPALQLLQCQAQHLGQPLKVYDPYIQKTIVNNQYHHLDQFLTDVDLVVVLVGHDEIVNNRHKLDQKIVLDTKQIFPDAKNIYRL